MVSIHFIFYAGLELRFPDVETNSGSPTSCSLGLQNTLQLCSGPFQEPERYDWFRLRMICCCALRPWSRTGVIYQSFWFLDLVVLSCSAVMECRGPVGWLHMCEMDKGHLANPNLSVAVVRCWYSGCVVLDRTSMCSVCISQPWPRWSDIRLFTNSNGSRAGSGCACLVPGCGWLELPSWGIVGFYYNDPSWCCCPRFCHCIGLWLTGDWPNSCTWRNSWHPDDWCSWPCMGGCCGTNRKIGSFITLDSHFDGTVNNNNIIIKFLQLCMINTNLSTCHQYLVSGGSYKPF